MESTLKPEQRGECSGMLSSGHNMASVFLESTVAMIICVRSALRLGFSILSGMEGVLAGQLKADEGWGDS